MSPRRPRAGLSPLLTAFFFLGACATTQSRAPEVQPDGTYRVACDTPLAACLAPFEKCHHGFDVVRAREDKHRRGPEPAAETVSSEAVLRCRLSTMFGKDEPPVATTPADKPATSCFPGSTHGCLGPGACQGAQICLASGAAFGPCDCGAAAPAPGANPLPATPEQPAPADAGVR